MRLPGSSLQSPHLALDDAQQRLTRGLGTEKYFHSAGWISYASLAFLAPSAGDPTGLRLAFGGTLDSGVLRIDPVTLAVEPENTFRLPARTRALATDAGGHRLLIATGDIDSNTWTPRQYSWLFDPANG